MSTIPSRRKGKGRANADNAPSEALLNAREFITILRESEPSDDVQKERHVAWMEDFSIALISSQSQSPLSTASEAGEEPAAIEQIADEVYMAHALQLADLHHDWPDWASPIITDAHARAKAQAVAQQQALSAERERDQREKEERLAAFLAQKKAERARAKTAATAANLDSAGPSTARTTLPATTNAPTAPTKKGSKKGRSRKVKKTGEARAATGVAPATANDEEPQPKPKEDFGPKLAYVTNPARMYKYGFCQPLVDFQRCNGCAVAHKGCYHGDDAYATWYKELPVDETERANCDFEPPPQTRGRKATRGRSKTRPEGAGRATVQVASTSVPRAPLINFEPHFPTAPSAPIVSGSGTAPMGRGYAPGLLQGETINRITEYIRPGPLGFSHPSYEISTDDLRVQGVPEAGRREVRAVRSEIGDVRARITVLQGILRGLEQYEGDLVEELLEEAFNAENPASPSASSSANEEIAAAAPAVESQAGGEPIEDPANDNGPIAETADLVDTAAVEANASSEPSSESEVDEGSSSEESDEQGDADPSQQNSSANDTSDANAPSPVTDDVDMDAPGEPVETPTKRKRKRKENRAKAKDESREPKRRKDNPDLSEEV
ncbi:hypothetical protein GSI_13696 [Ganoderma sinense ZZ0214-1]|uniref:Uncharacterized protein n=1 Tax=Ganoderma sinense ZZ0214-1 TaxID=1077348 RepID=A0A2G8RR03_9APHY|nr:hypothetical protein GSI_13696 [Ganoderma sinense ZZ0214-1]